MPVIARLDHVDARVPSVAAVEPFYDVLMTALGWVRKTVAFIDADGEWRDADAAHPYNAIEYYAPGDGVRPPVFIGFIEDPAMLPNRTRIAFGLEAQSDLEAWEARLRTFGARNIERSEDMDEYPALFFEDPVGTKLELCARLIGVTV